MKKLLLFLSFAIAFAFSTNAQSWTYLVYMVGSDLESGGGAATSDLFEMMEIGSSDNVNVVVTTGGADKDADEQTYIDWRIIERYRVVEGELEYYQDFSASDNDMANPENLTDFIVWGVQSFPADRYALILWDHGSALDGFGHDEISGNMLSVNQLRSALGDAYQTTQTQFDVLGFDACLMANLEVAYNLKDYAKYYVASEELEPGHGWDYTPIIDAMQNNPSIDGAELGKVIADGFLAHSVDENTDNVTLSVTDLSKLDAVITELTNFTTIYKDEASGTFSDPIAFTPYIKARSSAEEYGKSAQDPENSSDVVDIYDWAVKSANVDADLDEAKTALIAAIEDAVVYSIHDRTKPNSNGLSVYLPNNQFENKAVLNENLTNYAGIDFSSDYKSFVVSYADNGINDVAEPTVLDGVVTGENGISTTITSDDIEEAYVALMGTPDEDNNVIIFGYMIPDEVTETFEGVQLTYEWDGLWIGINDQIAFVSDIYDAVYEDETGTEFDLTVIEVPADLNGESIIMTFYVDEEGDFILESITPDIEESGIVPRESIVISEGDKLNLIYEGFNTETEDEFWYVGDDIIVNTVDDIELQIVEIPDGDYLLGYYISDYFGNETFLVDETVYGVNSNLTDPTDPIDPTLNTSTGTAAGSGFEMYISNDAVEIAFPAFENYIVSVYSLSGTLVYTEVFESTNASIPVDVLNSGYSVISISDGENVYTENIFLD